MTSRALVLGAGGSTGMAWLLGVVAGLREGGIDLMEADLLVGTSAGALGAARLAQRDGVREEVDGFLDPDRTLDERLMVDNSAFATAFGALIMAGRPAEEIRTELGAMALAATPTQSEDSLREIIASYMSSQEWPKQRLLVAAVDAESGELAAFDQDSGVALRDALVAAGSVPIVWAPKTIGDRHYMDAFVRSPTNADLAAGADRVVVIAPIPEIRGLPGSGIAPLATAFVITPDKGSRAAIGRDQQDLANQPAAARGGLAQGRELADAVRPFWSA